MMPSFRKRRLPEVSEAQARADQLDAHLDSLLEDVHPGPEAGFAAELAAALAVRGAVHVDPQPAPDTALVTLRAGLATKSGRLGAGAERRRAALALTGMAAMIAAVLGGFSVSGQLHRPPVATALGEAQASLVVLDQQVQALQSVAQSNDPVEIRADIQQAQVAARAAKAKAEALPDRPARQVALAVANQRISDLQVVVRAAEAHLALLDPLLALPTTTVPSTSTTTATSTTVAPSTTTVPTTSKTTVKPRPATTTTSTTPSSTSTPSSTTSFPTAADQPSGSSVATKSTAPPELKGQ